MHATLAYWLKETDVKELKKAMKTLRWRLEKLLPDLDTMTDVQIAAVLMAYETVIRPNFLQWMMLSWLRTTSKAARKVGRDNLLCEVADDHPVMLRRFAAPLYKKKKYTMALLAARRVDQALVKTVDEVTSLCYSTAHWGLLTMALLENLSLVFIPWMKAAADRLGLKDQKYLKVHGVADIKHAEAYCRAVVAQDGKRATMTEEQFLIDEATTQVMILLEAIFTAHLKIDAELADEACDTAPVES